MDKKRTILIAIVVFLVAIIITGSSYAFWSWNSNTNKNVVFNISNDLKDYIVYNEGESAFVGDLNVSNTYQTGSIHSTISIYKTQEAANVDLYATIHMDINKIGDNMKVSSALKWVVTAGTTSNIGNVLGQGNFVGVNAGDTLTLVSDIEVTTTETFYTIWIWLDNNENPNDLLSGEVLDTDVWTEVNQTVTNENRFEITRKNANYQKISATVIDDNYKIVSYAITETNNTPSNWTSINQNDQGNIYTLTETVNATGTYYIWFKDENNRTISESINVSQIDTTGPTCTWGTFAPTRVANTETAQISLACTDNDSGLSVNNLTTSDITSTYNKITVTNVTKNSTANGQVFTITVTGTESNGADSLTLTTNAIKNIMGYGNQSVTSENITIANEYTVNYLSNDPTNCPLDSSTYTHSIKEYGTPFHLVNPTCTGYSFKGWTANNTLDTSRATYGNSSDAVTTPWTNASNRVTATWFENLPLVSSKAITLTANFADDIAPTGTVEVSYANGVITATTDVADAGTGLDGTYYWKVSTSSTCDNTIVFDSNDTTTTNTFDYTIPGSNFYYACLKVSDNAGNTNYIRSDMISDIVVTFDSNSGSPIEETERYVALNQPYGTLPTDTSRHGYTFSGWSEYQQVEYIEATGTQYINTGYYPSAATGVYVDFQFTATGTQKRVFSVDTNDSGSTSTVSYALYINGSSYWAYAHQDGIGNWISTNQSVNTNRHTVAMGTTDNNIYIDDGLTYSAPIDGSITKTANFPMFIFARNNTGAVSQYAQMKLYEFVIYENYEEVKHFVPCYRISDNEAGLCDTISKEFYGNAGTGAFTIGSEVINGTGPNITASTLVKTATDHTLYANWIDEEDPTGTLTLEDDNWIITATINASDTGSGLKNNYGWLMSNSPTCDSTVTGFVETTTNNYTFNDALETYVCARIEDNAGNVVYLSARTTATYYRYTGEPQIFTASESGYYEIEMYGAQGGTSGGVGGYGGHVDGYIYLDQNSSIYIYVGGQGTPDYGSATTGGAGWNGGGSGSKLQTSGSAYKNGAGGGGATDIRTTNGNWDDTTSLNSRIIVAAGGGGGAYISGNYDGGAGGNLIGTNGAGRSVTPLAATQTTGYAFGSGQDGIYATGSWGESGRGGAGGGYYGGYASQTAANGIAGGAGGSSFISGFAGSNAITASNDRTHTNDTLHYSNKYFIKGKIDTSDGIGNGRAKITYRGQSEPIRTNTDLEEVRYIRDCINGSTVDNDNGWVELQVIKNGVNIAKGLTVTGSVSEATGYDYSYITDGLIDNTTSTTNYGKASTAGLQCITIDLGDTYDVDEIAIWHYFADGRTFRNNTTYVSDDKFYWIKAIENTDAESSNGKRVNAWDPPLTNNEKQIIPDPDAQTYEITQTGYYKLEVWGAQGGGSTYANNGTGDMVEGGQGGYSSGYVYLNQGDLLYLYLGSRGSYGKAGTNAVGGSNGGGAGGTKYQGGAGGGGATDIRYFGSTTPSASDLEWDSTLGLNSRIIVAGGGAGTSNYTNAVAGGAGGTLIGGDGKLNVSSASHTLATGGKQSLGGTPGGASGKTGTSGTFGIAGNSQVEHGSGGGGGYYGGAGSGYVDSGVSAGSGGSSFISGYAGSNAITASNDRTHTNNVKHYSNKYFIKNTMLAGVNSGNGRVEITYYGTTAPAKTNTDLEGVRYIRDCVNGNSVNTDNSWVEIQAIKDGVNIAKNLTVTGTVAAATGYDYSYITDGMIDNTTSTTNYGKAAITGIQCVTIDLGNTYNIDELAVWHYFVDGRTYTDNVTYVSTDKLFWIKAIANTDAETSNGKRVTAWDTPIQSNPPKILFDSQAQKYPITQTGYYKLEAWGASGAASITDMGGYSSGYVYLTQGDNLYFYTGGVGNTGAGASAYGGPVGGYNGGGDAGNNTAASGGGATDFRYFGSHTPTDAELEWNSTLGLNSRILVAGGGGGSDDGFTSATNDGRGGSGGNLLSQGSWVSSTYNASYQAGQTIGNAFGIGGSATTNNDTGAAGGGYYGGLATNNNNGGGGGGSSFISGYAGSNAITASNDRTHTNNTKHYSNKYFIDGEMSGGIHSGNGIVNVTYYGASAPAKINTDLENVRYIKDCVNGSSANTDNSWVELQAIKDGVNIAKNLTVTGTVAAATGYDYSYITDGLIDNTTSTTNYGKASIAGLQCVTIDLGNTYNLDEIAVWHYFADERTFNSNTTYVSSDKVQWIKAIDNTDAEGPNGKRVNAWDEPIEDNNPKILFDSQAQKYLITQTGYYKLEAWGASGAASITDMGGYSSGYVYLTQGDNLYFYTGGVGNTGAGASAYGGPVGGYNGGGDAGTSTAASGGGATDFRYFGSHTPTDAELEWNSTLGLNSRILVAGGGGGSDDGFTSATNDGRGGSGGNLLSQGSWVSSTYNASYQAGQTIGNAFGIGGSATVNNDTGAAGGGYYGGLATNNSNGGGGGGSSFISGYAGSNAITADNDRTHTNNVKHYSNKYFIDGEMSGGIHSGNGMVRITYYGATAPTKTNTDLENIRYIKDCVNGSSANTDNSWVELQAIKDGVNIAKNLTVTGTVAAATGYEYTYITDGLIDNTTSTTNYGKASAVGFQCITIDLGNTYDLDEVAVWHYFADGRTFNSNTTYVSNDKAQWIKAIDNTDAEGPNGKRVNAWDEPIEDNSPMILFDTNAQVYPINQTGYYEIKAWGAQGGVYSTTAIGGEGGYSRGYVYLTSGDKLYLYTGEQGKAATAKSSVAIAGGYNGGGTAFGYTDKYVTAGGGATDVRYFGSYTPTDADLEWNSTIGLNSRILVAGGGAGSGYESGSVKGTGGAGGTLIGNTGAFQTNGSARTLGQGGSQTAPGSGVTNNSAFGIGGGAESNGTAGGSGYYGGGPGQYAAGGGGGSSFISGYAGANAITASDDRTHTANTLHYSNKLFIDGEMLSGSNTGNGRIEINYYGEDAPTKTNTDLESVRYIRDCVGGSTANGDNSWVELQAIKNGINIAKGLTVAGTVAAATGYEYTYITDGLIDNTTSTTNYGKASANGIQCITIDLGNTYDLDEVAVWHYFADGRTFNDSITYVSNNMLYWKKIIDNTDAETSNGKRVNAWDEPLANNNLQLIFSSSVQEYQIDQTGYYKIEAKGAEGGRGYYNSNIQTELGGLGAYASGIVELTAGDKLYLYIGGKGTAATAANNHASLAGGYNGGGNGVSGGTDDQAGAGGGATDVRYFGNTTPSASDLAWDSATGLDSRILVAAGGGGGHSYNTGSNNSREVFPCMNGSGLFCSGTLGVWNGSTRSVTITQRSGGTFGLGQFHSSLEGTHGAGGGGGGYIGGTANTSGSGGPGAGGTSFMSGYAGSNAITDAGDRTYTDTVKHYSNKYFIDGEMQAGVNSGNGSVSITYIGSEEPERTNTDLSNVRYIKDCISGSSANADNSWIEIQAIKDGVNIAKGLTVTGTVNAASGYDYSYITDGLIDNTTSTTNYGKSSVTGIQCVTIDLGSSKSLDEVAVWHYFIDGRTYNENTTYTSVDGLHWKRLIDNTDAESANGKRVNAWDEPLTDNEPIILFDSSAQAYPITQTGYYKLEAWGAEGGRGWYNSNVQTEVGGLGAYASGYVELTAGDYLYLYTGGKGTAATAANNHASLAGGYNGGANGVSGGTDDQAGAGGGATDIRYFGSTVPSSSDLEWNSTLGLNSRILVAAGGGGGHAYNSGSDNIRTLFPCMNGSGLGCTGTIGIWNGGTRNVFIKQTSGGTFGTGAAHTSLEGTHGAGGGGGGYYGGTANTAGSGGPGAGGTSFISGYAGVNAITASDDQTHTDNTKHYSNKVFLDGEMTAGINSGVGRIRITYQGVNEPTRTNTDLEGVRYIRDCVNGNSVNTENSWVELQVIKDGINLAKGRTVVNTSSAVSGYDYAYVTDGLIDNITSTANYAKAYSVGNQCITIDLGTIYDNLDEIAVWHYYLDGRTFTDNVTFVSSDNMNWKKAIDSNVAETINGKRVNAWDIPIASSIYNFVDCTSGTYLPTGSGTCVTCPAGRYCPGGSWAYDGAEHGIGTCPVGSYSLAGAGGCTPCQPSGASGSAGTTTSAGATSCNASCNKSHVGSWNTTTWNNVTNTMSNVCSIATCSGSYGNNGNQCLYCSGEWGYGSYNTCAGNCQGGSCGYFYNSRTGYSQYNCSCYP